MIRAAQFVAVTLIDVEAPAQESESEFKSTPWHVVDIWWDTGRDMPFESYSIDVDTG
jgi:hypothetical protein